jgi:hypothetical protein
MMIERAARRALGLCFVLPAALPSPTRGTNPAIGGGWGRSITGTAFYRLSRRIDSRLQWSADIPIGGHFSAYGMPDRRALSSACVIGKDWGQLGCAGYMRRTPDTKPATSLMFRFSREQRRALKKLAGTPRGVTEHLLIAHGFSVELLCGLVHAQLAAVVTEPIAARGGVTTRLSASASRMQVGLGPVEN